MLYTASNPEDETQHLLFHNQFISAVKYVVRIFFFFAPKHKVFYIVSVDYSKLCLKQQSNPFKNVLLVSLNKVMNHPFSHFS